jgi:hypothetical protein
LSASKNGLWSFDMNHDEELDVMVNRYLNGEASPDELSELHAVLKNEPARAATLYAAAVKDEELRRYFSLSRAGSSHAGRTGDPGSAVQFRPVRRMAVRSVAQRYLRESARANWGFRFVATIAASLVIVAGGYWLLNHSEGQQSGAAPLSALAAVQTVDGKLEITRGAQRFPVTASMQVCDGDTLVVAGDRKSVV